MLMHERNVYLEKLLMIKQVCQESNSPEDAGHLSRISQLGYVKTPAVDTMYHFSDNIKIIIQSCGKGHSNTPASNNSLR
jgi:hypothetical protein